MWNNVNEKKNVGLLQQCRTLCGFNTTLSIECRSPNIVAPYIVAPYIVAPYIVAPNIVAPYIVAPYIVNKQYGNIV
jgi:hypothetical protein